MVVNLVENAEKNHPLVDDRFQRILNEGRRVPVNLQNRPPPAWFDYEKFKKGQQYFHSNYFSMFVAKLCGLLMVLSISSILKVLVLTGKSSEPAKAYRRYVDTIINMIDWYTEDVTVAGTKAERIAQKVRGQHCAASKKCLATEGRGISQMDMALTQFGFMGICLTKADYLGIKGNHEELEGFIHFWRTIGYCMGIEDKFNICEGSVAEVKELCEYIRVKVYKPAMASPPADFPKMSLALMKGVRVMIPFINTDAFMTFCGMMLDLETSKPLTGSYAKFILQFQIFVHTVLLSTGLWSLIFVPLFNFLMRLAIFLHRRYPSIAARHLGDDVYPEKQHTIHNSCVLSQSRLVSVSV